MDWGDLKGFVIQMTVEKDALHIYAAFAVQVAAAMILKRPLGSWVPWLCVLGVEVLNEALDLAFDNQPHFQARQWIEATRDILNTMILPTLLLLLCRFAPRIFAPDSPKPAD